MSSYDDFDLDHDEPQPREPKTFVRKVLEKAAGKAKTAKRGEFAVALDRTPYVWQPLKESTWPADWRTFCHRDDAGEPIEGLVHIGSRTDKEYEAYAPIYAEWNARSRTAAARLELKEQLEREAAARREGDYEDSIAEDVIELRQEVDSLLLETPTIADDADYEHQQDSFADNSADLPVDDEVERSPVAELDFDADDLADFEVTGEAGVLRRKW